MPNASTDHFAQTRSIYADLHSHSVFSDGVLTPETLMAEAAKRGITHLALTDHDTTDGLARAEAAGKEHGVELITGTELTCRYAKQTIHMLGYGIDPEASDLQEFCRRTRELRDQRYRDMIGLLQRQPGLEGLTEEEAWPKGEQSALCRPQLAKALVEHGYAHDVQEVFDCWLGDGKAAAIDHRALSAQSAIDAIRAAGGVAVIAHCGKYRSGVRIARELLGQGMAGIEIYHPDHAESLRERLKRECERKSCLRTGGSDFHDPAHRKGALFGRITLGDEDFNRLMDACHAARS